MTDKKSDSEKTDDIERFYSDAFCAKSAKLLNSTKGFEITGVVKIDTGDKRGIMFIGRLEKISDNKK